jgi:phenylacetate-coenzyme A ligase PaaK-like adenylate-forming protein
VIRYDLGDSVVARVEACGCGSPLPVIEVAGRRDDVLVLSDSAGRPVRLLPLALETVVERATAVYPVQIVRRGDAALDVRLPPLAFEERQAAWTNVALALRAWLEAQGLGNVALELDPGEATVDASSGKLRRVVTGAATRPGRRPPS